MLRPVINLFIIACLASWLAMTSIPSPMQAACLGIISPIVDQLGLVLRFSMFAPDAPKYNHTVEADITFADGSHKIHRFKILSDYKDNFWLQQTKAHDSALNAWLWHTDDYPELKEAAVKMLARRYDNSSNPPRTIALYDTAYPICLPSESKSKLRGERKLLLIHNMQEGEL